MSERRRKRDNDEVGQSAPDVGIDILICQKTLVCCARFLADDVRASLAASIGPPCRAAIAAQQCRNGGFSLLSLLCAVFSHWGAAVAATEKAPSKDKGLPPGQRMGQPVGVHSASQATVHSCSSPSGCPDCQGTVCLGTDVIDPLMEAGDEALKQQGHEEGSGEGDRRSKPRLVRQEQPGAM